MNKREITEAMEACRPDSNDLRDAEMTEVAEALQRDPAFRERCDRIGRWDRLVADAMDSCPVPEGLDDRLLHALSLNDSTSSGDSTDDRGRLPTAPITPEDDTVGLSSSPAPPSVPRRSVGLRRGWLIAAMVGAAAVILAAVILNPFDSRTPRLTADFADEVIDWTDIVSQSSWQTDFNAADLRATPFDASVQAIPRRWTCIETRFASRTFVYDLTSNRNAPAYLFCFSSGRSSLPNRPPNLPFSTTGGFSIGAWQRGDLVYVLAVRGGERRYRGLIQSPIILGWRTGPDTGVTIGAS